jgi:hypothetical protein
MTEFSSMQIFGGYQNKHDITSLAERTRLNKSAPYVGYLVPPSRNVLFGDDGLPTVRQGYSLYGASNAALTPITCNHDWRTSSGSNRSIRFYNGVLELDLDGAGNWQTLNRDDGNSFAVTAFLRFAEWWSDTEKEDELLMVDGTSNIHEWSGATATFASCTANTITLQGSTTWAKNRFLTAGTRALWIKDDAGTWHKAAYTGGETTITLTGTGDLTSFTISAGNPVIQGIRTTSFGSFTQPSKFATTDVMDLIAVFNNQVLLAYTKSRYAFLSKQNSFTNYTNATPRIPGDGDSYTFDGTVVGFATGLDPGDQNTANAFYVSAGQDFWYQVTFTKSADLVDESSVIKRLPSGPRQGAKSQELIINIGTSIYFIASDNTLLSLADLKDPNAIPLSDSVKTDFDGYDFTSASLKYFQPYLHVVMPVESIIHPYNIVRKQWEPPQIFPAGCLAVINEELYMHSNAVPESYKLFDGTNDNGNPIDARMYFSYHSYGDRFNYKNFNVFASEGYISSNTKVLLVLKYDFGGFRSIKNFLIDGGDPTNIFATIANNSLGQYPLGEQPIGSFTDSISGLPKFRHYKKVAADDFFELQVGYELNQVDGQFKLLACGPNIIMSDALPVKLIK